MQSKKHRILALLEHTDLTNAEIARDVGCHTAYVRVVQQRLVHGGRTPSEVAWQKANQPIETQRRRERYHSDPAYRDRKRAIRMRHYYKRKGEQAPV